jgi:hypothetical protein
MVLSFDGCEQYVVAGTTPPATNTHDLEKPNQSVLRDGGREMLVGDADDAQLPELTDPDHRGSDHHRLDDFWGQASGKSVVHDLFRRAAVPDAQDLFEPAGEHADLRVRGAAERDVG